MSRERDVFAFCCEHCRHEVEVAVCSVGETLACPRCRSRFAYSWPGPTDDAPDTLRSDRRWIERELPPEQATEMPGASLLVCAGCVGGGAVEGTLGLPGAAA